MNIYRAYVFVAVLISPARAKKRIRKPKIGILEPLGDSCKALVSEIEDKENSATIHQELGCETPSGQIFMVEDLPPGWIKKKLASGELISGSSELEIPGAMLDRAHGKLKMRSSGEEPGIVNRPDEKTQRRKLLIEGDKTVLVVRVEALGGQTSESMESLADSVFGSHAGTGGNDPTNLRSQYIACSYNKLRFNKANNRAKTGNTGSDIVGGAVTVKVDTTVALNNDGAMNNAITAELNSMFDVGSPAQLADYVMYCLPDGTMNGIAYAYINSWLSVYSDEWCTYLSGQMHEIGHNLGLAHSNEQGTYRDQSGMMGYSYSQDDGPKMCFNAAKSWQLGWYADTGQSLVLSKSGTASYEGRLSGVVHYDSGTNQIANSNKILIKLNRDGSNDFYITFNAQTSFNSGTVEGGNRVMIVSAGGEGNSYAESELEAKLIAGQSHSIPDFDGTTDATITVNSIDSSNYADVSICIGECGTTSGPTPSPTPFVCPPGDINLEVDILTDNYPAEITWTLVNDCNGDTVLSGGPYNAAGTRYSKSEWAPCNAKYTFTINDSYGDGVCCGYGSGSYDVKRNGAVVVSGGQYGSQDVKTFGSCDGFVQPPTRAPTKVPTKSPTGTPTRSPTLAPTTGAPSKIPTKSPTQAPTTKAPTAAPIISPTDVPTKSPTQAPTTASPTDAPSKVPTKSPTQPPTGAPTGLPTGSPTDLPTQMPTTASPTQVPTTAPPSKSPTEYPTQSPTTASPTEPPSKNPTRAPTSVDLCKQYINLGQCKKIDGCQWDRNQGCVTNNSPTLRSPSPPSPSPEGPTLSGCSAYKSGGDCKAVGCKWSSGRCE